MRWGVNQAVAACPSGPKGNYRLAPLYDVMSAYPVLGNGPHQWSPKEIRLAMALLGKNRHYTMHDVQRRHFNSTAQKVGYASTAEPIIEEILARTPEAISRVQTELPSDFSPRVLDSILGGLEKAAKTLSAMGNHRFFSRMLSNMPHVGSDADFERRQDDSSAADIFK